MGATNRKITLTKVLRAGRLTAEEVSFESVRCAFADDHGVRCRYVVAWDGRAFVDVRASSGGEWRTVTGVHAPYENGSRLHYANVIPHNAETGEDLLSAKHLCNNEASRTVGNHNESYVDWLEV